MADATGRDGSRIGLAGGSFRGLGCRLLVPVNLILGGRSGLGGLGRSGSFGIVVFEALN